MVDVRKLTGNGFYPLFMKSVNCHSSGVADEVSEIHLAHLMVACLQQLLLPDLTFTRFGS